jgi:hypothetical protein
MIARVRNEHIWLLKSFILLFLSMSGSTISVTSSVASTTNALEYLVELCFEFSEFQASATNLPISAQLERLLGNLMRYLHAQGGTVHHAMNIALPDKLMETPFHFPNDNRDTAAIQNADQVALF